MIKPLLLCFVFALGAAAQCTVSPSTVVVDPMAANGPHSFAKIITLSAGCGAWSTTGPASGWWFMPVKSGTAPSEIWVKPYGVPLTQAAGTVSTTITFSTAAGSRTINLSVQIVPGAPKPIWSTLDHGTEASKGCSYDTPSGTTPEKYWQMDICTFPYDPPYSFLPTQLGKTYADPFGSTPILIMPQGLHYSKRSYVSVYDKTLKTYFVITRLAIGSEPVRGIGDGIYAMDGSGKLWEYPYDGTGPRAPYRYALFSSVDSRTMYSVNGVGSPYPGTDGIYKLTLGPSGTFNYLGRIWHEPTGRKIRMDNYNQPSADDLQVVLTSDKQRLYVVDLKTGDPADDTNAKVKFASFDLTTMDPPLKVDNVNDTQGNADVGTVGISASADPNTGKYFIRMNVQANQNAPGYIQASRYFTYDAKTNKIEHTGVRGPTYPDNPTSYKDGADWLPGCSFGQSAISNGCVSSSHSSNFTVAGIPLEITGIEKQSPYAKIGNTMRYSAGDLMSYNMESGGGLGNATLNGDYMAGARHAPVVATVNTVLSASGLGNAYYISTCTAANPTVCTLRTVQDTVVTDRSDIQVGDQVIMWGAKGNTTLNGVFTVSAVDTNTITIPADNSAGTYVAYSAYVTRKGVWGSKDRFNWVTACRVGTNGPVQCRKLAWHMGIPYGTGQGTTITRPEIAIATGGAYVAISPDGKYVVYSTNGGYPGRNFQTYAVPTGFDTVNEHEFTAGRGVKWLPVRSTSASVTVEVPDNTLSYSCVWSLNRDYSSGSSATLGGSANVRTADATDLQSKKQYWWRCKSADDYYVAAGSFVTP